MGKRPAKKQKSYELSNHLGNVMAVISDRGVVQSAQDYDPFGMSIPGRSTDASYKYGFNGQEKDLEMGEGIYTAEFWQYDARLGRRMNVDPKPNVSMSLYACFENNPIWLSDRLGDTASLPQGATLDGAPPGIDIMTATNRAIQAGNPAAKDLQGKNVETFMENAPKSNDGKSGGVNTTIPGTSDSGWLGG